MTGRGHGGEAVLELPMQLDRTAAEPLQRQLIARLRAAMLAGQLAPGTRLPATRALALALGVSRNVVVGAYDELFAEGYVTGRHGSGTYVEASLPRPPRAVLASVGGERWMSLPPLPLAGLPSLDDGEGGGGRDDRDGGERGDGGAAGLISFRPGVPALDLLPVEVWRRVWRVATEELPPNRYAHAAGEPALREALARWVGRSRGVACGPDDVVITTGAAQAMDLLVRATVAPGAAVAFEEPGYPTARNILLAHGARIVPVPVDADGMQVERLPSGSQAPILACVTPSHQYPLGGRLPIARRLALLAWARANDSLIVEDDYDSEFRFDAPPLPALLSLEREGADTASRGGRVAYIGTFAKSLAPSLRLGYLVAPAPLRERVTALKALTDRQTSWPVQRAVLALLAEGHLERHIRRARRRYAESRAILRAGLQPVTGDPSGGTRLIGLEAGLHACLELAPGLEAARIVAAARLRGVAVGSLSDYYFGPPDRQGLVLGYGGLEHAELARGARILAEVIAAASGMAR